MKFNFLNRIISPGCPIGCQFIQAIITYVHYEIYWWTSLYCILTQKRLSLLQASMAFHRNNLEKSSYNIFLEKVFTIFLSANLHEYDKI